MGQAKPLPHTSELHSGLSVPTARSLYSECIGVERASLEAWTRYTRVLFTRLVQSGRFIPSHLREVLVAVVVFRGEQLTGAIGKAMDEARLLVDWKLGRVPKTNGDATISCDSCTAPLTRVTNRDARSRGYCDCCQRLAVFTNAKNKWTARLCASCAHADPSVLDKLQPPSRFQAMSALLGPLRALSGVVPHANGDAVDPTRHTLKEELKLWKRRQKTLRGAHVQVFKIAKRVFNYSHDKYAEELEVERGFCSAMEAYVAYLLAKAAEQGVPNCLSLHSAALVLYGGCTPPCHAKPYLQELPIASKNAQQQPPCTRCNAVLDHPARVDSFPAFCDCCERVLPLAAVVADSTQDGGTSRCLVCHTVSESTDGDQPTLPSRIDSTWLHQLNKRVKKLGNKLVKSVKVELPACYQAASQAFADMRRQGYILYSRHKGALANATTTPSMLHSMYDEEVQHGDQNLAILLELLAAMAEISDDSKMAISNSIRNMVNHLRKTCVPLGKKPRKMPRSAKPRNTSADENKGVYDDAKDHQVDINRSSQRDAVEKGANRRQVQDPPRGPQHSEREVVTAYQDLYTDKQRAQKHLWEHEDLPFSENQNASNRHQDPHDGRANKRPRW